MGFELVGLGSYCAPRSDFLFLGLGFNLKKKKKLIEVDLTWLTWGVTVPQVGDFSSCLILAYIFFSFNSGVI